MKKKKRLLALALCLVMVTSLLPLTAAAEETRVYKSVAMKGEVKKSIHGSGYYVAISERSFSYNDITITHTGDFFTTDITTDPEGNNQLNTPPVEGETYYAMCISA